MDSKSGRPVKNSICSIFFSILVGIFCLCFIHANNSISVDELIDSYEYNFISEEMGILSISDQMIDTNANSINDTLKISLTTSQNNSNLIAIIILEGKVPIIQYKELENQNIIFDFKTVDLQDNQFNYTIEFRTLNYELVYRNESLQTQKYSNFERGVSIGDVSFQQNNNLVINVDFRNISTFDLEEKEIQFLLDYNNILYTFSKNITFESFGDIQKSFQIPEELLKNMYINGNLSIQSINVGNKNFIINKTISNLNFRDFITSPHVSLINHTFYYEDYELNQSIENMELQFEIEPLGESNLELEFIILDQNENVITILEENRYQIKDNIFHLNISNEILFEYGISDLQLSQLTLKNSEEIFHQLINPVIIPVNKYNIKTPELSELSGELIPVFNEDTQETNIEIRIRNEGIKDAYNVDLIVFSKNGVVYSDLIPYFEKQSEEVFTTIIPNSFEGELYTLVVDSKNLVIETNEEDNSIEEFSIGPHSLNLEISSKILPFNINTSIVELKLKNKGSIPLLESMINISQLSTSLIELSLRPQESQVFYFEIENYELNETNELSGSFDSRYIQKNFSIVNNLNFNNSTSELSHIVLGSNIVEFRITNIEFESSTYEIFNLNVTLDPQSSTTIFKQFTNLPNVINYKKNGLMKEYRLSKNSNNSSHPTNSTIHKIAQLEDNYWIYEVILHNKEDSIKNYDIVFDSSRYVFILDPQEQKRVFVQSLNEIDEDNIEVNQLNILPLEIQASFFTGNSHIHELIFQPQDTSKDVYFNLGEYSYTFDVAKDERKVLFVEKENQLEINTIILK